MRAHRRQAQRCLGHHLPLDPSATRRCRRPPPLELCALLGALILCSTAALASAITTGSCCVVDIGIAGHFQPISHQHCAELVPVPFNAGGDGQLSTPRHLMRCINEANRTHSLRAVAKSWADEVATVQAAGAWWSSRPATVPVTVVTQLSISRLPQLWAQCRSWRGPLSAAVYVPAVEGYPVITKRQLWCAMQQTYAIYQLAKQDAYACDLDVVLLYEQRGDGSANSQYPVNVLRNIARLQARTEMVAMVDVDMLMSTELLRWLGVPSNVVDIQRRCREKQVFVLPAFEVVGNVTQRDARQADAFVSSTKSELMKGVRNGSLSTFAAMRYARGHFATNFARWAETGDMYEVPYASGFEPWVMTHRSLAPWHDARFRGYGLNKISHIAHLNASGYKFVVHTGAFIIHRAHSTSTARKRFNTDMSEFYVKGSLKNITGLTPGKTPTEKPSNIYFRVNHLFVMMKHEMDRNRFTTVLDPATQSCLRRLSWWQ